MALLADWPQAVVFGGLRHASPWSRWVCSTRAHARPQAGMVLRSCAPSSRPCSRSCWSWSSHSSLQPLHPAPSPAHRVGPIALVLRLCSSRVIDAALIDEDIFKRRVLVYGAGQRRAGLSQLRRRADQRGFIRDRLSCPRPAKKCCVEKTAWSLDGRPARAARRRRHWQSTRSWWRWTTAAAVSRCKRTARLPARPASRSPSMVTFLERETGKVHLDVLNPSWMIFGGGFPPRRACASRLEARLRPARELRCCWCWPRRSCC